MAETPRDDEFRRLLAGGSPDNDAALETPSARSPTSQSDAIAEAEREEVQRRFKLDTSDGRVTRERAMSRMATFDGFRAEHGPLIGLVGNPSSGKTELAMRWKSYAELAVTESASKTTANYTSLLDVAAPPRILGLVDVAGENLNHVLTGLDQADYSDASGFIRHFLWPTLRRLDGLVMLINLPLAWRPLNPDMTGSVETSPEVIEKEILLIEQRLVRILYMTKLAASGRFGDGDLPRADQIGPLAGGVPPLRIPVFVALTKADLYRLHPDGLKGQQRGTGLHGSPEYVRYRPDQDHPFNVLGEVMPDLRHALDRHARAFTAQYMILRNEGSRCPDPAVPPTRTVLTEETSGLPAIHEVFAWHPWRAPGLSAAACYRIWRRGRVAADAFPVAEPEAHDD